MVDIQTIRDLDPKLRDVLGQVAIGQDGWVVLQRGGKTALRRLEELELIIGYEENIYGAGSSPMDRIPVKVKRYDVPTPVHIAWCEWCAEQPDEEVE